MSYLEEEKNYLIQMDVFVIRKYSTIGPGRNLSYQNASLMLSHLSYPSRHQSLIKPLLPVELTYRGPSLTHCPHITHINTDLIWCWSKFPPGDRTGPCCLYTSGLSAVLENTMELGSRDCSPGICEIPPAYKTYSRASKAK